MLALNTLGHYLFLVLQSYHRSIPAPYLWPMSYLFFKSLHIIGFVSWFAGIFYIVRLFVYHREAWDMENETGKILRAQYEVMEGRLFYIIQTPAMIITLIGGIGMLIINNSWLTQGWMHLKLTLVVGLILYHFSNLRQLNILKKGPSSMSSFNYRLYNELPTLVLIAIVMMAVWKNLNGLWLGLVLLLVLGVLFFAAAKWYRRIREK